MFRRALSSLRNSTAHASHYDLIVLGSGPASQKCAIDAAKRGKSVAMVDRTSWLGGVCTHTGTLPSKTLREAIISSTGFRARNMDGSGVRSLRRIDGAELVQQVQRNTQQQKDIIAYQLRRNNVDWIDGYATFEPINSTRHVLHVTGHEQRYTADYVLIAVGTAPHHAPEFDFSLEQILDSDEMATQKHLTVPRSLLVVGGGVIGMEYASMINIIPGTYVTVIDKAPSVLPFVDREMVDLLLTHFRQSGGRTILNDQVLSSRVVASTNVPQGHPKQSGKKIFPSQIAVTLRSGKTLRGDALLYCMGRRAQTDSLNLPNALGVQPNPRGHLSVNAQFQVLNQKDEVVPGLYAAGDVIGIPALASTAMEQGRRASCHMWSQDASIQNFYGVPGELFPYGIYTVPEISMVGETEEQLTRACVRYETCQAKYSELARAQLVGGGDSFVGLLKILFCPDTLRLFGVHIIGDGATEIAHIGQTVMALGGTLEYFRSTVFNYPTFAEAYRVAALAGLGKVSQYRKLK